LDLLVRSVNDCTTISVNLPHPWQQAIAHLLGVFAIAVQLLLQRSVFQRCAHDEEGEHDERWNERPQRSEDERRAKVGQDVPDVSWVAHVSVGASAVRFFFPLEAPDADTQIVSVIADPLQVAQRFGKDNICFRLAYSCLQALNVSLARFHIEAIELVLHATGPLC
jgi:hypothetical protein